MRRRISFWVETTMIGGRLTLASLGAIATVVGGSAIAYWQWANGRPLVVAVGAVALVLVLMEAAYRRWDKTDRELQAALSGPPAQRVLHEHREAPRFLVADLIEEQARGEAFECGRSRYREQTRGDRPPDSG